MQIDHPTQLGPTISKLLSNPKHAEELGRNASTIVQQNAGATERALELLEPIEVRR